MQQIANPGAAVQMQVPQNANVMTAAGSPALAQVSAAPPNGLQSSMLINPNMAAAAFAAMVGTRAPPNVPQPKAHGPAVVWVLVRQVGSCIQHQVRVLEEYDPNCGTRTNARYCCLVTLWIH